ncbi:MAG TPA: hypothetical protein VIY29_24610 [Ktedonobacteraceae bacterium]
MPKDNGRYRYFSVGLERGSWALGQVEADARKHHMSDQPGKLIALRLTEYYELLERGALHALAGVAMASGTSSGNGQRPASVAEQQPGEEELIAVSQDAEQNADEAADYWSTL